ncbi:MAG TPA: hypothetical protein VD907_05600 [Verrucomicrobiae bacterium]|nr:hypothetical protein [Verrucomicrobiae bacterium]
MSDFTLETLQDFSYVTSHLYAPMGLRIALEKMPAHRRAQTNQALLNPVGTSALTLRIVDQWFQEQRAIFETMDRFRWQYPSNPAFQAASILFGFNAEGMQRLLQVVFLVENPSHLTLELPRMTFRLFGVKNPGMYSERPGQPAWWKAVLAQPESPLLPQMDLRRHPADNWRLLEVAEKRRPVLLPNPPRISMLAR